MNETLTIGRLAKLSGVAAKTIRYYEESGLLPPPKRAANGYRMYDRRAVDLLRFVSRARGLGFAIKDVETLLALWSDDQRRSSEVRAVATAHMDAIDRKMAELAGMRDTLRSLVDRCHGDQQPDCPILDELASEEGAPGAEPTPLVTPL